MSQESHEPKKPDPPSGQDQAHGKTRPAAMPPAGPHAEPHLTNDDATPGTGSLTKSDHSEVETDPGGG